LALALLVGAGLIIRSFIRLQKVDLGFNPANVLTMQFDPTGQQYDRSEGIANFYQQLVERVQLLPGVRSAALFSFFS